MITRVFVREVAVVVGLAALLDVGDNRVGDEGMEREIAIEVVEGGMWEW